MNFLSLYPRAWRERYGDELQALIEEEQPLTFRRKVDLVIAAIDARFEPVPASGRAAEGVHMSSVLKTVCARPATPMSTTDGLKAAGVMILVSLWMVASGIAFKRIGWLDTAVFLKGLSFPVSMVVMSHYMFLRGQSPRVKWIITGGTLAFLIAVGIVSNEL